MIYYVALSIFFSFVLIAYILGAYITDRQIRDRGRENKNYSSNSLDMPRYYPLSEFAELSSSWRRIR